MAIMARLLITEITATGARLVIDGDRVGIDREIPSDLLEQARLYKDEIRAELLANQARLKRAGLDRLVAASCGLPLSRAELEDFFKGDLEALGRGEGTLLGLKTAVNWLAFHLGKVPIH